MPAKQAARWMCSFGYKLYLWLRRSFTMAAVFSHYQGIPP